MGEQKTYHLLGLMSGSSLDGLDICFATITSGNDFHFTIHAAETFNYSENELNFFRSINTDPEINHLQEDIICAEIFSEYINRFLYQYGIKNTDAIASHGHTIFHYPQRGITCQLGNGKLMAERTGLPCITNFRQADVSAGGQGAPLVPMTDELFFSDYDACLNIGGIANISFRLYDKRIGFDICAANQLLNYCAQQLNLPYDDGGIIAKSGKVHSELLSQLNGATFFSKHWPRSMDNNEIRHQFIPMLNNSKLSVQDQLATATEHIADRIAEIIRDQIKIGGLSTAQYRMLVTGGGALNGWLLQRIQDLSGIEIHLPSLQIIHFKEALAMCLMGVLRLEERPNFLPSVTGARMPVCGGDIYLP